MYVYIFSITTSRTPTLESSMYTTSRSYSMNIYAYVPDTPRYAYYKQEYEQYS